MKRKYLHCMHVEEYIFHACVSGHGVSVIYLTLVLVFWFRISASKVAVILWDRRRSSFTLDLVFYVGACSCIKFPSELQ